VVILVVAQHLAVGNPSTDQAAPSTNCLKDYMHANSPTSRTARPRLGLLHISGNSESRRRTRTTLGMSRSDKKKSQMFVHAITEPTTHVYLPQSGVGTVRRASLVAAVLWPRISHISCWRRLTKRAESFTCVIHWLDNHRARIRDSSLCSCSRSVTMPGYEWIWVTREMSILG
jgi:hypothetical protein